MRSLLKTHTWFVLLISLLMGWSGIAQASAAPMHQMMLLSMQASSSEATASHAAMQNMRLDCHQATPSHSAEQQTHTLHGDMEAQNNCHALDTMQSTQVQCQECAQYHCQTTLTLLDIESLALLQTESTVAQSPPYFDYQAQHLVGFWQEILRPPKT